MIADSEQPAMIRIVGKAIISGKGFDVIENMLNRSIGKATSHLDLTTDGEKIQQQATMTAEQINKLIDKI